MNERKKAVVNLAASGLKPADELNDAHKNLGDSRFGVGLSRLLSTYVLTPYLQTMTRRYLKMEPVQMDMLPGPQRRAGLYPVSARPVLREPVPVLLLQPLPV